MTQEAKVEVEKEVVVSKFEFSNRTRSNDTSQIPILPLIQEAIELELVIIRLIHIIPIEQGMFHQPQL